MFVCIECLAVFETPETYMETHGFDNPPYEEISCCPYCGGAYVEAHRCDHCGEWIDGAYIKLDNGGRFCENCYMPMEVGDEDDLY